MYACIRTTAILQQPPCHRIYIPPRANCTSNAYTIHNSMVASNTVVYTIIIIYSIILYYSGGKYYTERDASCRTIIIIIAMVWSSRCSQCLGARKSLSPYDQRSVECNRNHNKPTPFFPFGIQLYNVCYDFAIRRISCA